MQAERQPKHKTKSWQSMVAKYQRPEAGRSIWQIVNSFVPFFVIWYAMYRSLEVSYWLTLGLSFLAAGFLTRIFIILHDCGHGAFFRVQKVSDVVGFIAGVLTWTPYRQWRHDHAIHHATSGDLDRRGVGDIWTMTVEEYEAAPRGTQIFYRIYRTPLVLFGVGALYYFLLRCRFPTKSASERERFNVYATNLALAVVITLVSLSIGFTNFLLVQTPITVVSCAFGVWLFYVQHQFEDTYWEEHPEWDYFDASMQGSSFYKLPKVLQWFTGNIGFHHIHHLSPKIPNYNLEKCHLENPAFQRVPTISLATSLKSVTFRLWDEDSKRMVGFRFLKNKQPQQLPKAA